MQLGKWGIWIAVILLVIAGLWWMVKEGTKPLPGQAVADMGREHIADISDVNYNSNPPTSGPHFAIWAKRGVYDRVISDGHLIHSLEHGYVIISYNCEKLLTIHQSIITKIYAHDTGEIHEEPATSSGETLPLMRMMVQPQGDMSFFTPDNPPLSEVELSDSFKSDRCKNLVGQLSGFLNDYRRLIIVPRLNLDAPITLTAWNRILKLDSFDKDKIKAFISVFENKGPERTQE